MTETRTKISCFFRLVQILSSITHICIASIAIHEVTNAVADAGRKFGTDNTILYPALAIPSGCFGTIFSILLMSPLVKSLCPVTVILMEIFALAWWCIALTLNTNYYVHEICTDTWVILNWSKNERQQNTIITDNGIMLNCYLGKALIGTSAVGCGLCLGLIVLVISYSITYAWRNHLCKSTRFFIVGGIFPKDDFKLEILFFDSPLRDDSSENYCSDCGKCMHSSQRTDFAW